MNKFYFMLEIDEDNLNSFNNLKKYLEDHPIPIILKPDDSIKRYVEQHISFKSRYTNFQEDPERPDKHKAVQ